MPAPAPVAQRDRVETLDVLRGFALLGILAMNVRAMAAPFSAYMYPYYPFDYTGANRLAYLFTSVVFDLKMMGLFSMLFGAGLLLYAAKPTSVGATPRALWFRRMGWLLAIGLVHAYLIWDGDILVPYALCGMLLLWWVRQWPARRLAAAAALMLIAGATLGASWGQMWDSMPPELRASESELWMPTREQSIAQLAALQGSYLQVIATRASFAFEAQTFVFATFFFWRCGGMMLLGMALWKWGFLSGRRETRDYALAAAICLPVGLALAAYGSAQLETIRYAMPERTVADLWNYTGAVLASVGYAATLILIVQSGALAGLRHALAAVGQMALTNYLMHSVIGAILFLGWGFGLAGRADYAEQLLFVAGVWLLQLIVSPVWLRQFRFGPAEWIWRSLTYWERQPMRRAIPSERSAGGAIVQA
jgi:uncharacterized protein